MTYLHQHSVTHNDLKDENIIVSKDLQVKLVDFGSATIDDGEKTRYVASLDKSIWLKTHLLRIYCGSEPFTSPEAATGGRFFRISQEIWSLGVMSFSCGIYSLKL